MAALSVQDRTRVLRGLMRRWSDDRVLCGFLKTQLYDPVANTGAVADIDTWVDGRSGNNAPDTVGFNGALSIPMRSALSVDQKTDLLLGVAAMRRGLAYVKSVFGEVD